MRPAELVWLLFRTGVQAGALMGAMALTACAKTAPKRIDVAEAPMKGNGAAKVTLVEFADYECPHCKRLQPVLRQVVDEFHNDVKVYFKHYPLPQHTNARLAAEAAVAAHKQGKFWTFQDKLWDKQDELSPAVIEKSAKDGGLDVAKF